MFKGIKNIASEIRSEVTGHESLSINGHLRSHSHSHSHSQSQSSTASSNSTSKTRRFLSNNRNSNGSSGLKKKSKEYIEVDGKTEDETIVHLALLKYFNENKHSTGIPDYLRKSNGSFATTGSAFDTRRTNESSKSPKSHTYNSSSMAKSMSTPIQLQQQKQPDDRSEFDIPNPTQFRSRQSSNPQLAQSSIPGRPELRKASTESDTYKQQQQQQHQQHYHHYHDQFQSQSESPPSVQRHVAPSQQRFAPQRTQSTTGRFQSRFSNNATSTTSGAVSGSSSRFGRRVQ